MLISKLSLSLLKQEWKNILKTQIFRKRCILLLLLSNYQRNTYAARYCQETVDPKWIIPEYIPTHYFEALFEKAWSNYASEDYIATFLGEWPGCYYVIGIIIVCNNLFLVYFRNTLYAHRSSIFGMMSLGATFIYRKNYVSKRRC